MTTTALPDALIVSGDANLPKDDRALDGVVSAVNSSITRVTSSQDTIVSLFADASLSTIDLKRLNRHLQDRARVDYPMDFDPTIRGVKVPRLSIQDKYPHIGDHRIMAGSTHVSKRVCMQKARMWLARIRQCSTITQHEFVHLTNCGLLSFADSYAMCSGLTFLDAEEIEKIRARDYRSRFRTIGASSRSVDRFLPAAPSDPHTYRAGLRLPLPFDLSSSTSSSCGNLAT